MYKSNEDGLTQSGGVPKVKNQSSFVRLSTSIFGKLFNKPGSFARTSRELASSRIPLTTGEFLSTVATSAAIFGIVISIVCAYLMVLLPNLVLILASSDFLLIVVFVAILLEIPGTLTRRRTRDINAKLPIAIAFVATLASADVSIDQIINELSVAREFGEVAKEARAISVSSSMFGNDIITAMREVSASSPSRRLGDFLQGIITTVTSGGDLKVYFTTKSKEYYGEQENLIKKNSESVGIMSEAYITVGVAFPLILMIILGVVGALSPVSPTSILIFIYLIALLMIPAIALFFIYVLRVTLREVEV